MKMRENLLKFLTFLMCLLSATAVSGLALTDAEVKSFLNQPLEARIGLISAAGEELDGISVTVSSVEDKAGSQRFQELKHEIIRDGQVNYIRVSSRDVIREPVLSFRIEVNWPKGHLVREYSLLIDPQ